MSGTALDSNVLLALWNGEASAERLAIALDDLQSRGRLVICGAVYAELLGRRPDLDTVLPAYGISVDPQMLLDTWQRAGEAHAQYAERRRLSGGGLPRRILTDMLVGAHASVSEVALLTLNTDDYGDFPEVPLLTVLV